jgi:hypothetical protein
MNHSVSDARTAADAKSIRGMHLYHTSIYPEDNYVLYSVSSEYYPAHESPFLRWTIKLKRRRGVQIHGQNPSAIGILHSRAHPLFFAHKLGSPTIICLGVHLLNNVYGTVTELENNRQFDVCKRDANDATFEKPRFPDDNCQNSCFSHSPAVLLHFFCRSSHEPSTKPMQAFKPSSSAREFCITSLAQQRAEAAASSRLLTNRTGHISIRT